MWTLRCRLGRPPFWEMGRHGREGSTSMSRPTMPSEPASTAAASGARHRGDEGVPGIQSIEDKMESRASAPVKANQNTTTQMKPSPPGGGGLLMIRLSGATLGSNHSPVWTDAPTSPGRFLKIPAGFRAHFLSRIQPTPLFFYLRRDAKKTNFFVAIIIKTC